MKKIRAIAWNVFSLGLRAKTPALVLFFAIALVFFIQVAGKADESLRIKMILDAGLSLVKLFGLLLVLFHTLPLFPGERDRNTMHASLSLNLPRRQYLWGLYLGNLLILLANLLASSAILSLVLWGMGIPLDLGVFRALFLIFLELCVLSAFALCYSVMTGFLVATMLLLFTYMIGNMTSSIHVALHESGGGLLGALISLVYYLLPNFSLFHLKEAAVNGRVLPFDYELLAILYAVSLICIVLQAAVWTFERQEIA